MRVIASLSLSVAFVQLLGLTLGIPTLQSSTSSLVSRSPMCFNSPGTKAGTYLARRAGNDGIPPPPPPPPPPPGRTRPIASGANPSELIIWCQQMSRTYVSATWVSPLSDISWSTAQSVLAIAVALVHQTIQADHDGPVMKGTFLYGLSNAQIYVANANNHQMTLGVLGAALLALSDFFTYLQDSIGIAPGRIRFAVVDGENEVGQGYFDHEFPPPASPPAGS